MSYDHVRAFLEPASIAVVGASADPSRISGMPVRYLREAGYSGAVYPINPRYDEIQDLPAFASVLDTPTVPDLAIIGLGKNGVPDAVTACAEAGVKGAIVFASGFAETGAMDSQRELVDMAREHGLRLLGPNCAGLLSTTSSVRATFGSHLAQDSSVPRGPVAVVCQSGAVGAYLFSLARQGGKGVSHWVTTGNEGDLTVADFIGYIAQDGYTRSIAVYLEEIRDVPGFMEACLTARANGVSIVAIKSGKTRAGQRAAQAHTAALATDSALDGALLRELGVVEVNSLDDLLGVAWALAEHTPARGSRLGLVTVSGAAGVIMADAASDAGLSVPELSADIQTHLIEQLPYAGVANPVDVTGNIGNTPEVYESFLRSVSTSGEVDAIVCYLGQTVLLPEAGINLIEVTGRIAAESGLPIWLVALPDPSGERYRALDGVVPVLADPVQAIRAVAFSRELAARAANPIPDSIALRRALAIPGGLIEPTLLADDYARQFVADGGLNLPLVPEALVTTAEEAEAAALRMGPAVVLKAATRNVGHKAAVGGVRVNVAPYEASRVFESMLDDVRRKDPTAEILGAYVQPQLPIAAEILVGVRSSTALGPTITVGFGGRHAEAINLAATSLAPLTAEGARELIVNSRIARVLAPTGAMTPALELLTDLVHKIATFAWDRREEVAALEVNPFILTPSGELYAADLLIEVFQPTGQDPAAAEPLAAGRI